MICVLGGILPGVGGQGNPLPGLLLPTQHQCGGPWGGPTPPTQPPGPETEPCPPRSRAHLSSCPFVPSVVYEALVFVLVTCFPFSIAPQPGSINRAAIGTCR